MTLSDQSSNNQQVAHLQRAYAGVGTGATLCGLRAMEGRVVSLARWPNLPPLERHCKRCERRLKILGSIRAKQIVR